MKDLVEVFKALSNRNRMRIYRTIRIRIVEHQDSPEQEECCGGDICKEFEITPSTISQDSTVVPLSNCPSASNSDGRQEAPDVD